MSTGARLPRNFDIEKAYHAQRTLARRVVSEDDYQEPLRVICFLDAAYSGDLAYVSAASFMWPSLHPLEKAVHAAKPRMPYIPTLLGFREVPLYIATLRRLHHKPDLIIVDGHGRAHPRRFGLACHLGLAADLPCIGVAKKPLVGEVSEDVHDGVAMIKDGDETVGAVVEYLGRKLYLSVGHRTSLNGLIALVKTLIALGYERHTLSPFGEAHRIASSSAKRSVK